MVKISHSERAKGPQRGWSADEMREAYDLRNMVGMTYWQIAERTGRSTAAVYAAVRRWHRHLVSEMHARAQFIDEMPTVKIRAFHDYTAADVARWSHVNRGQMMGVMPKREHWRSITGSPAELCALRTA